MRGSFRVRSPSSSSRLILRVVDGRLVVESHDRGGCFIEVLRGDAQLIGHLCKLELDPASPLTPRTAQMEPLRARRNEAEVPVRALSDGVWWCTVAATMRAARQEHFFTVNGNAAALVPKVQAYVALGAVEALEALGLGDAAISLAAGDFDHASVQVIAHRDQAKVDDS